MSRTPHPRRKIGYAVVGLGHIAQTQVLPAFEHASRNSRLVGLVSGDAGKAARIAKRHDVSNGWSYDEFDECLSSEEVEAGYLAVPNTLHADLAIRAARAGVHVLVEKPMAASERECEEMIRAAEDAGVKLMVAYRLHFEEANMRAVELARSGKLGELRYFTSSFSYQVKPGNIRVRKTTGGGPLWDIGIYCLNAARYLFQAEPSEVFAFSVQPAGSDRFREVEEAMSVVLRFPEDRLATFTCSFGATSVSSFQLVGTRGELKVEHAYGYSGERVHILTVDGRTTERTFPAGDQFAPELIYFSDCVIEDHEPEPSGQEGLADVRVIRALYRSASTGKPVKLEPFDRRQRPDLSQVIRRPPISEPKTVHAEPPRHG